MSEQPNSVQLLTPELKEEFKILFGEFVQKYLSTPKGQKHVDIHLQSVRDAKLNFKQAVEMDRKGQDITDFVLEKLLPHQNTKNNRKKRAWIHPAPAVTKDLKSWFEGAKWASKEDWPDIAKGVFLFVSNCIENPENLAQECDEFLKNPKIKGIQTGFLSPILNALDGDRFILINKKPALLINHFAETKLTTSLSDYSEFNEAAKRLLENVKSIISPFASGEIRDCDVFDMFSHWLTAEKKYWETPRPLKGKQYWSYAPGEDAKYWDEYYQNGIMGIGWNRTGNLQKYKATKEIQKTLKDAYGYKTSARNSALSCYDFAHTIKKGDVIFVKRGVKELIGYGIVESDYFFDETREGQQHVRKMNWKKKGSWKLNEKFALKTLTNITPYPDFVNRLNRLIEFPYEDPELTNQVTAETKQYWWLSANPKIWNPSDFKIGQKQTYTSKNKKGNKRRIYKNFIDVKPGDLIIGYVASPIKEVTSLIKVTKGLHDTPEGEGFEFEIKDQFKTPLPLKEAQAVPDLKQSEPLRNNNQGSLFKLTKEEFDTIQEIITEKSVGEETNDIKPYSLEDELKKIFISSEKFQSILNVINHKKNIILQGPPGVGKTFIAKHIAYAMMGIKDDSRISMIQFHQSYSYEDFMQGFRPNDEGKFDLVNGIFYEFCRKAQRNPSDSHFFIIDEINRGNLSKIFGEMLMLIEADKRGPDFSIPLTYSQDLDDKFFIPKNLFIIGTMNTADRSLAMVDYALRRRFGFISLMPKFTSQKFIQYLERFNLNKALIDKIVDKMTKLNEKIAKDNKNLGRGYKIGHSYFCPTVSTDNYDEEWYRTVITTEIEPLVQEYWFDDPQKAQDHIDFLMS